MEDYSDKTWRVTVSGMDCGRFDELKDAYNVLGAPPEEDRRAFEGRLASHPDRRAEIEELLRAGAHLMVLRALRREPPPELKGRVVGALRGQPRTRHPDRSRRRRPDGSGG